MTSVSHRGPDSIAAATEHLAQVLRRIESGELQMNADTVSVLEESTRTLERLVNSAL